MHLSNPIFHALRSNIPIQPVNIHTCKPRRIEQTAAVENVHAWLHTQTSVRYLCRVCPATLTETRNGTLSTTHSPLCRDAGAVCYILQMGNFSFPGPHCTQAPAVCAECVCEVGSYVCEHVGGRARRACLLCVCVWKGKLIQKTVCVIMWRKYYEIVCVWGQIWAHCGLTVKHTFCTGGSAKPSARRDYTHLLLWSNSVGMIHPLQCNVTESHPRWKARQRWNYSIQSSSSRGTVPKWQISLCFIYPAVSSPLQGECVSIGTWCFFTSCATRSPVCRQTLHTDKGRVWKCNQKETAIWFTDFCVYLPDISVPLRVCFIRGYRRLQLQFPVATLPFPVSASPQSVQAEIL